MAIYEESKLRKASLQCKVQRVYDAGEAIEAEPNNKTVCDT